MNPWGLPIEEIYTERIQITAGITIKKSEKK